jgi:hypothetical protein
MGQRYQQPILTKIILENGKRIPENSDLKISLN